MTIMNEAVRLFFAVSALILVAMLSTPMGGFDGPSREVTVQSLKTETKTGVRKLAAIDKKPSGKRLSKMKIAKATRKVAKRG